MTNLKLILPALLVSFFVACSGDEIEPASSSCLEVSGTVNIMFDGAKMNVDIREVSNDDYLRFVEETGYLTRAERGLPEERFAFLPKEARVPGSAVFVMPTDKGPLNPSLWWKFVDGASWKSPNGPGSDIDGKGAYPVVHIAYEDAVAYSNWAGRRLPDENEWEYAARGGLVGAEYEWGDKEPDGTESNYWQGIFPIKDNGVDGFVGLAPSACFKPNGYGLHDMTGNVWEWTSTDAPGFESKILRGGSFLCSINYCSNFRPTGMYPQDMTLGTSHIGFRTVADG